MKSIYLLLTRSQTFVSRAIHLATDDPYTHVSIAFESDLSCLYSFARRYAALPLPAGLVEEHLHRGFWRRHGSVPCALLKLEVEDAVYEKARKQVAQMMKKAKSYHYSVVGLALCRMQIAHQRRRHYFCSQFVGEVLQNSGALCLPKPPSLMRPVDFDLLPSAVCLFRGQLWQLSGQKGYPAVA